MLISHSLLSSSGLCLRGEQYNLLISLHLPKTAGASFAKTLQDWFGSALLMDYDDIPLNTPVFQRKRMALNAAIQTADNVDNYSAVECIHGHFLAVKYGLLAERRNVTFVTWMRDPVERVLSHYYFLMENRDPNAFGVFHRKVFEEKWSVERFCLSMEMKNVYCQFLWSFPLCNFSFVGVTENYSEDVSYFSRKYLGQSVNIFEENVREKVGKKYTISDSFRRALQDFHSEDIALYKKVLTRQR